MWAQKIITNITRTITSKRKVPNCAFLRSASTTVQNPSKVDIKSTVDQAEVDLFSKQMNEWWDPQGPMKLLHSYNLLRVPFVRDGLVPCGNEERELLPLQNMKVLDVGCGGGILSEALARIGAKTTGIDPSSDLIKVADAHKMVDPKIADNQPNYYNVTIEDHSKQYQNHYDGIVASEVIEHVNHQELFVKSCIQALKPGGRIFFTTPNRTQLSLVLGIYVAENILRITPKGAHQYEKFITPNELSFILERNDCNVECIYGILYNFINNKWSFTSSQKLLYGLQAQKMS